MIQPPWQHEFQRGEKLKLGAMWPRPWGKAAGEGAAQFHWRRQYHPATTVVSSSCDVGLKGAVCAVDGRVGEVVLSIDFLCPEVHEAETWHWTLQYWISFSTGVNKWNLMSNFGKRVFFGYLDILWLDYNLIVPFWSKIVISLFVCCVLFFFP